MNTNSHEKEFEFTLPVQDVPCTLPVYIPSVKFRGLPWSIFSIAHGRPRNHTEE